MVVGRDMVYCVTNNLNFRFYQYLLCSLFVMHGYFMHRCVLFFIICNYTFLCEKRKRLIMLHLTSSHMPHPNVSGDHCHFNILLGYFVDVAVVVVFHHLLLNFISFIFIHPLFPVKFRVPRCPVF